LKIGVAQIRSKKGDIDFNIVSHKKLIELAAVHGAAMIIFPELSLTGYNPSLANELATTAADLRFNDFQKISDRSKITIGVGVPLKNKSGVTISMILFQPGQERLTYSKKYLHADEEPFFVSGENFPVVTNDDAKVGLAICYELFIAEHTVQAFSNGAQHYVASVAKVSRNIDKALFRSAGISQEHSAFVLMANAIGLCEEGDGIGKTSAWHNGELIAQLDTDQEGVLIVDTDTKEAWTEYSVDAGISP